MTSKSKVTLTFAGEDKQLRKTFDNVEKRADRLQDRFKRFSKIAGAAGLAIGGMAVAGGTALFKLGESFDKAYDKIITGTGATGDALEGLQDSFKNVLATGPDSMDAVATAIADLNAATGQVGKPLEDLSRQILDLSRLTGEDLPSVIKSTTRLFGDWGIAVEDQSLALDKLFVISQQTGIGIQQLSDAVVKSGAPFRQLGLTFDESIALIGKWNKEGVNTEIIISGIRQAISKFAREGKDIPSTFAAVIKSIEDAGSASEATTIAIENFGAEAGPDLAAAVLEGRLGVEDLTGSLGDAEGQIGRTADATASFGEKWEEFKNKLAVALEPAATKVFDAIGDWLDDVGPKLEKEVIPAFEDFWETFTKKGGEVKRFIENDLGPVLQGMFDDLNRNFKETEPKAEGFFSALADFADAAFGDMNRSTENGLAEQESKWNTHFRNGIDGVSNQFQTILDIFDRSLGIMTGLVDTASGFIQRDWDKMYDGLERLTDEFRDLMPSKMRQVVTKIDEGLAGLVTTIETKFRDAYNAAVSWINKIPGINIPLSFTGGGRSLGGSSRSGGSRSFTSRSTPRSAPRVGGRIFHSGGPVRGQRIGQEVPILAKSGEHVLTANQMSAMRSGGGGPIVIKIDSGGSRMDDLIVQILRKSIANRGGSVQAVLS